jgi:hypothetical protein
MGSAAIARCTLELPISVLFYDQAQRIYSLTPATGSDPDAPGFAGVPVNADSTDHRYLI